VRIRAGIPCVAAALVWWWPSSASAQRVVQEFGTDLALDAVYPFDTVAITSVTLSAAHGTGVGGNVSAAAIWQPGRTLQWQVGVRSSAMTARLPVSRTTIDVHTGGVQLGGGLRIVF
jgi:hypothetical protein